MAPTSADTWRVIFTWSKEEHLWLAVSPEEKGVHSYGKTKDEARTNIREAIACCLPDVPDAPEAIAAIRLDETWKGGPP